MEKEYSKAITQSFIDVLNFSEFTMNPLVSSKLEKVIELTFVPIESKHMQFEVKFPIQDDSGKNLNTQYEDNPNEIPVDFIVQRIITNYKTDYNAGIFVSLIRKTKEKEYEKKLSGKITNKELEQPRLNESHVEVVCRIARNQPQIWSLMEESYSNGFRYSGMGYQEIRYVSEQEGNIWVKRPILGIPGIFEKPRYNEKGEVSDEEKARVFLENMKKASIILNFSKRHQIPDAKYLETNGYKSEAALRQRII